jgi:hypothetical protein
MCCWRGICYLPFSDATTSLCRQRTARRAPCRRRSLYANLLCAPLFSSDLPVLLTVPCTQNDLCLHLVVLYKEVRVPELLDPLRKTLSSLRARAEEKYLAGEMPIGQTDFIFCRYAHATARSLAFLGRAAGERAYDATAAAHSSSW